VERRSYNYWRSMGAYATGCDWQSDKYWPGPMRTTNARERGHASSPGRLLAPPVRHGPVLIARWRKDIVGCPAATPFTKCSNAFGRYWEDSRAPVGAMGGDRANLGRQDLVDNGGGPSGVPATASADRREPIRRCNLNFSVYTMVRGPVILLGVRAWGWR